MIVGEPRVVEDGDGQPILVDATGGELVCRIDGERRGGRIYHRVDLAAFDADGTIRPTCEVGQRAADWRLKRRVALDAIYSGCTYRACFGEFAGPHSYPQRQFLATRLEEMAVEEFDRLRGER